MKTIAIIDYGMSNLSSVVKAIEYIAPNEKVIVSSNAVEIDNSDKIIFPGQGAAKNCMKSIYEKKLEGVIKKNSKEKPFLGICMGMQVLMDFSDENNGTQCLSVIKGKVEKLKSQKNNKIKIPHMGWNKIIKKNDHPIWHNIKDGSFFYFVHSYYINPLEKSTIIGETEYGKIFSSVIAKNNIIAIQGHPEKSSDVGLQFLKNFIRIN
ncbi:MAG: imidazole glycerol phosphate synthase subunit HisH [Gammaproteobacteria bacterium]|nr:imidazole glycerol phosphate synthase subunit HisH [Gammaproteobacteria bacterium]MBT7603730.1 imidazole glycerol phosphate synthase subunit HisH [Gammaproteobacteria bacterium]